MTLHELATQPLSPEEHECAYKNRVEWYLRNMGSRGLVSAASLERQIEALHVDGTCPPTHVGTGPTQVWADLIDSTRI